VEAAPIVESAAVVVEEAHVEHVVEEVSEQVNEQQ